MEEKQKTIFTSTKNERMVVEITCQKEHKFVRKIGRKFRKQLHGWTVFEDEIIFDGNVKTLKKIESACAAFKF